MKCIIPLFDIVYYQKNVDNWNVAFTYKYVFITSKYMETLKSWEG